MCYERRSLTSDQKKTGAVESAKASDAKRGEVVGNLLREANMANPGADAAPAKEHAPVK